MGNGRWPGIGNGKKTALGAAPFEQMQMDKQPMQSSVSMGHQRIRFQQPLSPSDSKTEFAQYLSKILSRFSGETALKWMLEFSRHWRCCPRSVRDVLHQERCTMSLLSFVSLPISFPGLALQCLLWKSIYTSILRMNVQKQPALTHKFNLLQVTHGFLFVILQEQNENA